MSPRVSVVVPAYNNADYLAATLRSIIAQTYTDFELIVADHASTDGTWEVMETFADDPRVTLLRTEAGGGAKRNWDRVTEAATGELVKLVCGDDLIAPTMLERQVAAFDANGPSTVLVASQRDLVDASGKTFVRKRGLGRLSGSMPGVEALRATVRSGGNLFGEPACVMMRRQVLEDCGLWNDRAYYIDVASYARVLTRGDFVAVPESLAAFRVSASQWSVRLMREQAAQAAEFHREAQALAPATITAGDVRLGDVRAQVLAVQRRLAYIALGKRMHPTGTGA